jgi:hypothetical protein
MVKQMEGHEQRPSSAEKKTGIENKTDSPERPSGEDRF